MKIAFISDTHGKHEGIEIEPVDMLIHTGDFLSENKRALVYKFLDWYGNTPAECKVLVPGNHDRYCIRHKEEFLTLCNEKGIIYLENSGFEFKGLKIWGMPNAVYDLPLAAFDLEDMEALMSLLYQIPLDTDILLTHAPLNCLPGHKVDLNNEAYKPVVKRIMEINPMIHGFGHDHISPFITKTGNTNQVSSSAVNGSEELFPGYEPVVAHLSENDLTFSLYYFGDSTILPSGL